MNPTVFGGAASLLLLVLWWSGRRRPVQLLRSTDASAIAALNRAQNAAVLPPASPAPLDVAGSQGFCPSAPAVFEASGPALPQAVLLRRLSVALTREPAVRLAAMRYARAWGERATLPLLVRGLRDSDPAVVREAALAIDRFRGCPVSAAGALQALAVPLPRNVSRTL